MMVKPLMLVIFDGLGLNERKEGNAVKLSNIPNLTRIWTEYPTTSLKCSGLDVGLPKGQMGNSEVGHLNIGAGRIVYQDLTRIDRAIESSEFMKNKVFLDAIEHVKNNNSALHLYGLLSDGGVHSHINHAKALLHLAKSHNLEKVYLHAFLDGRDVPPKSAKEYFEEIEDEMDEISLGKVATVMGRYYAMDRDKRWERVKRAYDAMTQGIGLKAKNAQQAVDAAYERGETDEFVQPTIIVDDDGKPIATIKDGDAIIFYNFRSDRAREITRAFIFDDFNGFVRQVHPKVHYVCMTEYDETFPVPEAFPPERMTNILAEVLAKNGIRQLRIAETEKYAHVTFFFNGGEETPFEGEDRILIPSPKVPTYDLQPEMSAFPVTDTVLEKIKLDIYDVIILNFANPDMVGHTGVLPAAIKALEAIDKCVGRIYETIKEKDGVLILTADHGNCEQMIYYDTGKPHTAHTSNPVPFTLVSDKGKEVKLRDDGRLADIAPTMLSILGIDIPNEMTGKSLIVEGTPKTR